MAPLTHIIQSNQRKKNDGKEDAFRQKDIHA